MPTPTYDLLASNVLSSSASSVTFSSIPATYRDLIVVVNGDEGNVAPDLELEFNGDTTSGNYSAVWMRGNGSTTSSGTSGSKRVGIMFENTLGIIQIMDYSATDKHKTYLSRVNTPEGTSWGAAANANRWANSSAINSVKLLSVGGVDFTAGFSFYLYGIVS